MRLLTHAAAFFIGMLIGAILSDLWWQREWRKVQR